jgi:maleamate amidohydrolase
MAETLDDNYARAGYHAAQAWGQRPAVLMIDFANAYYDPASPLYGGEGCQTALEHGVDLAKAARAAGVPVIFTEVKYIPGGANGGAFYAKVPALAYFDEGRATQKLQAPLEVLPGDHLITKQYPGAFFGTDLDPLLKRLGVDTLLLAGLTTSGCVRATCIEAISHGYVTLVVEDACGDRAEGPHTANLFDMSAKYADLLSTDQATEFFKKLTTNKELTQ